MTATRRAFVSTLAGAPLLAATAQAASDGGYEPAVGDDGLYKQDWFLDSFLEFGDDLETAAAEGKGLAILWEQHGCPYCREMHRVNLQIPEIRDYMTQHYDTIQLDMWGSRGTVDFDGEEIEERGLARKWNVNFTPTLILCPPGKVGAQTVAEATGFIMPGYFKPFHFIGALKYVAENRHDDLPFQRYLQEVARDMQAQGIEVDLW